MTGAFEIRRANPAASSIIGYFIAIIAVFVTFGVRLALRTILDDTAPLIPAVIAIVVAASFGGLGPGLLATAGTVTVTAFFLANQNLPVNAGGIHQWLTVFLLAVTGATITLITEAQRRSAYLARMRLEHQKRTQTALDAANQKLDAVIEGISDAFMSLDNDWRLLYINRRAEELLGGVREVLIGKSLFESPNLRPECADKIRRAKAAGVAARFESNPTPGMWKEVRVFPSPQGVAIFCTDITQRRTAEMELQRTAEALRVSEERFRMVLRGSPVFAFTTDLDLRLTWAYNGRKCWSDDAYLGKRANELDAVSDCRELMSAQEKVRQEGAPWEGRVTLVVHGATEFYEARIEPIRDAEGALAGLAGVVIDVTDAARATQEIERRETRYSTLIGATNAIVWTGVPEGGLTVPQPTWAAYTGQTAQEYAGHGWAAAVHPDDRESAIADCIAAVQIPHAFEHEMRLWHAATGQYRYCINRVAPVITADGTLLEWIGTVTDVHEKRMAEQALRQSEDRLRLAMEGSGMATFETELATGRSVWSDSMFRLMGYEVASHVPSRETWFTRVHPEDRDIVLRNQQRARAENGRYDPVYRIMRADDGQVRWIAVTAQFVRDAATGAESLAGVVFDVTARKRAEEALRESEERFRVLSESTMEGVAIYDYSRILDANRSFARMFGYESEEVLNRDPLDFVAPESREAVLTRFLAGSSDPYEGVAVRKDGSTFSAEFRGTPTEYHGARAKVAIVRDITERKRIERQMIGLNTDLQRLAGELELRNRDLAERNRMLEESSRQKTHFLTSMSHELRTPLNAIMGFLDLLAEESAGPLNQRQQRYVERVRSAGQHLTDLVADILDLSRIEAGRVELALELFAVRAELTGVLVTLEPLAAAKRISLQTDIPVELAVTADRLRFNQILYNLLSNAIKYTPDGGRVSVAARSSEQRLIMSVEDTGIGIPVEHQRGIFDHFYQARRNDVKTGTGLGLAITRRLVELHGGSIQVESLPGEGSRFTFVIPLVSQPAARAFSA